MPTVILTEPERRALLRFTEQHVRRASPLAPRWLRQAIAERLTTNLSMALRDPTTTEHAQAVVRHALTPPDLAQSLTSPVPASSIVPTTSAPNPPV